MGDVNDDFTFTGAGTLNVGGNMSGGTFTASTGTVNYNGSGAQNVAAYTYNNLTISGGNTKTMQGAVTVNNILDLSNGNLSLGSGANNLTIGNASSITGSFDNTHMIVCDGTGSLVRQGNANADYNMVYPLGTGTNYTPMQISSFTATDFTGDITVRAVAGSAPGVNPTDLQKYWIVSANGLTITSTNVNFTYINPGEVGSGGDQGSYIPYIYNGTTWTSPTGSSAGGVNPLSVTGTNAITGTWTAREGPATYYSYQSGDWATAATWTTDPSGTLSVNPAVPDALDRIIILNGRNVYTTTGYTVLSAQINEGGTLDLRASTGHNFGTVSGQGTLRLSSNTFPGGTYTSFVAPNGGTVEYYNLNATRISSTQLEYNNLIISNYTGAANTVYLDNASDGITYTVNGNFDLKNSNGGSLTFNFGNPAASNNLINMTVYGNFTVNADCNIRVNNFASNAHSFVGSAAMPARDSPSPAAEAHSRPYTPPRGSTP